MFYLSLTSRNTINHHTFSVHEPCCDIAPEGVHSMFKKSNSNHFTNDGQLIHELTLMQPSKGTLNSPSSRVVKNSTSSRSRVLRYINFGIGESWLILFLDLVNLHLIIFEAW